jgi:hypothetical protein
VSRKLLLLNIVLAVLAVVVGTRARSNWDEAEKRAGVVLSKRVPAAAPPPFSPLAAVERAHAGSYAEVAQKTLFSADRNPTVIVEVAPPKPMPPLPLMHGVMDFGQGPVAMMSVKAGERQQEVHAGSTIGDFKLVSLSTDEVVLEWEGKRVVKKPSELVDRSAVQAAAAKARAAAPKPANTPAPAQAQVVAAASGPGTDLGGGNKACQPGDKAPAGTVENGLKKVVRPTPFGNACYWEPVQ